MKKAPLITKLIILFLPMAVGAFGFSSGAGWSVEEVWQVIRRETPYVWSGIRGLLRYFL